MNWNDMDEAKRHIMIKMWREGKTQAVIGAYFGVSKNTIAGIAMRNREMFPARKAGRKDLYLIGQDRRVVKPVSKPVPKLNSVGAKPVNRHEDIRRIETLTQKKDRVRGEAVTKAKEISSGMISSEYDRSRMPSAKPLEDRGTKECCFPINAGSPFLFCCAEIMDTSSYCADHLIRMHERVV